MTLIPITWLIEISNLLFFSLTKYVNLEISTFLKYEPLICQVGRQPPEMEKDIFWDESVPKELPYTIAALPFRKETDMSITDDVRYIYLYQIHKCMDTFL